MFSADPAPASPDLERLILDTARMGRSDPRLFIMAATWLARYGEMICVPRLTGLIENDLEAEHRPTIGVLLDFAQHLSPDSPPHFGAALVACAPATEPHPLFDVERLNSTLERLAERSASPISRRWNLWAREFAPKFDALRPLSWIIRENPEYRSRMVVADTNS